MSSKLGLILSMFVVALTFLFGADLITIQSAYTSLQNDANDIAYYIAKNGYDNDESFINFFDMYYGNKGLIFNLEDYEGSNYGSVVNFSLSRNISLFFVSDSMDISVSRSTIIGYYDY